MRSTLIRSMRSLFTAIPCALLLGSASLHAQQVQGDTPAQNAPPSHTEAPPALSAPAALPQGRLTGTVFCNDTHKPARGALVLISGLPQDGKEPAQIGIGGSMARVGNDGTFTAEHLRPGEYTAIAFQPGYLSGAEDIMNDQFQKLPAAKRREMLSRNGVAALRGSETATLNLTLERGATISGRVLYSDGAPAVQITLVLENTATKPLTDEKAVGIEAVQDFVRAMFTHQSMNTDDQGRFRISGLQPGSYRLGASQPTRSPMDTESGEGDGGFLFGMAPDARALRFYAGDTPHRGAAKVFDLRAGDQVDGVEITVPVDAFHTVRGSVGAPDGRAVNMGSLTLTDSADDTLVFHANIERDGTFKLLQVPSGTYTLKSSNARIGKVQRPKEASEDTPDSIFALLPISAFADGSTSVLVKDTDVSDITLSLAEIPMPKSEPQPQISSGEQIVISPH